MPKRNENVSCQLSRKFGSLKPLAGAAKKGRVNVFGSRKALELTKLAHKFPYGMNILLPSGSMQKPVVKDKDVSLEKGRELHIESRKMLELIEMAQEIPYGMNITQPDGKVRNAVVKDKDVQHEILSEIHFESRKVS